jgi:hypothetical protein
MTCTARAGFSSTVAARNQATIHDHPAPGCPDLFLPPLGGNDKTNDAIARAMPPKIQAGIAVKAIVRGEEAGARNGIVRFVL